MSLIYTVEAEGGVGPSSRYGGAQKRIKVEMGGRSIGGGEGGEETNAILFKHVDGKTGWGGDRGAKAPKCSRK